MIAGWFLAELWMVGRDGKMDHRWHRERRTTDGADDADNADGTGGGHLNTGKGFAKRCGFCSCNFN